MKKENILVAAIKNGTVIDHIPSDRLFEVMALLGLEHIHDSRIMIGYNLDSKKMGHKSLIKISDKFFTDEELNRLAIVAPNVSLSIIRDYDLVEKKQVVLPSEIIGLVRCNNPKCITNNEPMRTRFSVSQAGGMHVCCHYCKKDQELAKVKLV